MRIGAQRVHETLAQCMLVEGYPQVLDLSKSHGQWLFDAVTNREYLDLFTFHAARPLAFNHPKLLEPEYLERLRLAAHTKPSNCDLYTTFFAEFVETFRTHALGPGMKYLFLISGGALAVENALKAAFDFKAQKNQGRGGPPNPGRVLHFRWAFHGRAGYTLSLTNTADPRKTDHFPKFDWPRISSPALTFPLTELRVQEVIAEEKTALEEIDRVYERYGQDDIAAIIIEPIQAEGGDRHFRPEFFSALRRIADQREAILIFDEVQTGIGTTGTMWMYEQLGVIPDAVAFAKKAQTGGVMAGPRFDEVQSVFRTRSRISSTFGSDLVDFVRATRILEIIREEDLLSNIKKMGEILRAGVESLCQRRPGLSNPRGLGGLLAFDASSPQHRDAILLKARDHGLILLGCGPLSVRLRPALDIGEEECLEAIRRLEQAIAAV